jgi:hypothetical protein
MAKLNRMLATLDWDLKYPMVGLIVLPKGVSDHSHVQIQFGGKPERKYPIFYFEKWWLDMEDFAEVVQKAWDIECPKLGTLNVLGWTLSQLGKARSGT